MMKAARIYGPGEIRVETVADPVVGQNDVLVKVKTCGICGTDVHVYESGCTSQSVEPLILGHEFSGEIVHVGSAVSGFDVGDRVVGTGYRACGECHWCQERDVGRCINPSVPGEGLDGAFAEFVLVPNPVRDKTLFRIPESINWDKAATIEPLSVSAYAVERARLRGEETVVILGAGMIGQGVALICRASGISNIIISEPSAKRRGVAQKLGADVVVDSSRTDVVEAVAQATSGAMADVIFECSGAPAAFYKAPHVVRAFGRIIQVGIFQQKLELDPDMSKLMFQFRNLTLRGSGGQRWDLALDLLANNRVDTQDLITHRFTLDSAVEAFDCARTSEDVIKVLIEMG